MARSQRSDSGPPGRPPNGPTCPICRAPAAPGHKSFPFCSARCKLIDLGRWLGGRYRIEVPVEETDRDVPADEESPDEE